MPSAILRRRSIRVALVAAALATVPGTARRAVTQVIDACAWEGDTWGVGSAPLCDPWTECWTDRFTCTISARTRFLTQSFQATCPDCQPAIIDPNRFRRSVAEPPTFAPAPGDPVGSLERVSVAPGGSNADAGSLAPALSDDGRYVVFDSAATNLVPGDTNGRRDVFVFDRTLQQTERVSVSSAGLQGNGDSIAGSVSADGRFVAFLSIATDLVAGDTNAVGDVFVRDRLNGTTERINLGPGNIQATGVSVRWGGTAAGSWPVSLTDGFATFHYVNIAADNSETAISADGRYVVFVSDATNLVPSDVNQLPDVFVRDRQSGTTELVSVTNAGAQLVATATGAQQSTRQRVAISSTGQFVAFETAYAAVPGDTNNNSDVYVRDRQAGQTLLVSVSSTGVAGNLFSGWPSISGDGRYVAFASDASTLVAGDSNGSRDVFLRDRQTGLTSRVSINTVPGQRDHALVPAISRDGRWVAYSRPASFQVYLYDAATGAMHMVTRATATTGANAVSLAPALNADGSVVAFASTATNLTASDTNAADDVFVATSNLIYNGTFGAGAEHWQTFTTPAGGIVSEVSGGAMRFYRTGTQAVVLQPTRATVPQGVPLEARLDLANTSPSRRRVSLLVHDNDFTDLSVCTFWLAPGAPSRTYRMRTHTTRPWTNATLSIYAATVGSDGFYVVDNVSLNETPEYSPVRTDCVDPTAPIAPGGPDGNSLLVNGDFSAGLASWGVFGVITSQISAGVFEFFRPAPYYPAGVVLQSTAQALPAGDILRGAFDLGNSSGVRKRVTALLHDGDFSDLSACTFWLAPGQPLSPYEMRSFTTEAWSNATLSVYVATLGPDPWIRLDNASLRRSPGTTLFGTECIEPGGAAGSARPAPAAATPARGRDVPRNTIGQLVRTPITSGGVHYLAEPLDLAGTTRARLTFNSVLAESAAPGHVQTSEDGITWVTIAEVSASASVVPVDVDLSTYAGSRLHVRFVAGQAEQNSNGWRISRLRLWRD